jgi:hypothetical protein
MLFYMLFYKQLKNADQLDPCHAEWCPQYFNLFSDSEQEEQQKKTQKSLKKALSKNLETR